MLRSICRDEVTRDTVFCWRNVGIMKHVIFTVLSVRPVLFGTLAEEWCILAAFKNVLLFNPKYSENTPDGHEIWQTFERLVQFIIVPWPIGSLEAHEGRFSRDPLTVFSAGGHCEQFWHGQGCLLFNVDLALCRPRHRPSFKMPWRIFLERLSLQGTVKRRRRQDMQEKKCGKTISKNGQAWISSNHTGQWKTGRNGGNWLWSYLRCPMIPTGF